MVGNDTEEVMQSQGIKVGQSYKLTVTEDTKIISGKSIELTCNDGACSMKFEANGKVTIKGAEFLFEATGPAQIKGKDVHLN